jgi:hypothetical protein
LPLMIITFVVSFIEQQLTTQTWDEFAVTHTVDLRVTYSLTRAADDFSSHPDGLAMENRVLALYHAHCPITPADLPICAPQDRFCLALGDGHWPEDQAHPLAHAMPSLETDVCSRPSNRRVYD